MVDKGQKKTESHVRDNAPRAEISEPATQEQSAPRQQKISVSKPKTEKVPLDETSDPILMRFVNEGAD